MTVYPTSQADGLIKDASNLTQTPKTDLAGLESQKRASAASRALLQYTEDRRAIGSSFANKATLVITPLMVFLGVGVALLFPHVSIALIVTVGLITLFAIAEGLHRRYGDGITNFGPYYSKRYEELKTQAGIH